MLKAEEQMELGSVARVSATCRDRLAGPATRCALICGAGKMRRAASWHREVLRRSIRLRTSSLHRLNCVVAFGCEH